MEFEIFLFLGITSDFLLHLDIFSIMLHNSGSYLNFLFQLASYDVSLTGEAEALPHYCQVRVEIQCPHSTPFDPWWGELPVMLGESKSVSYTLGLHSWLSNWEALNCGIIAPHLASADIMGKVR